MKMNDILAKATTKFRLTELKVKKASPEILIVAGVIGTVASAVLACKATTKLGMILGESKETVEKIQQCAEDESLADQYSKDDAKKDLTITYIQTGMKIVKLYAPAVSLGVLSLTGIVASNQILRKRNIALAAAYATVDKTFKEYRSRVVERFGEAVDQELRYNVKAKTIEETVVDPKTGKEKTKPQTVNVSELGDSPYAIYFDETCKAYETDRNYNLMTLKVAQQIANDKLIAEKFLFLNDIYESLGKPRTKEGQIVGWVYRPGNPVGDNYVDFRVSEQNREMPDGSIKKYFVLDFNVDGNVLDLI